MVPNTSTWALTNATLAYVEAIADRGWLEALRHDGALARGLSTHAGALTSRPVAESFGREWTEVTDIIAR